MTHRSLAALALAAAATLTLSACAGASSAPASSSATQVIAPVTTSAEDLQGATVDLVVGQVLNITTGSLDVDSYTGEVADPKVATFTAGHDDGSAQFNPGVTAVGPGTSAVTLTNADGGIEPVSFTVVVTAR